MTLAEQLEELATRYVTTQYGEGRRMTWGSVGNVVRHAVHHMGYGDSLTLHLRDQYDMTGVLWLYMAQDGKLEWTLTGKIAEVLEALR
jgi:hypothetical protein